MANENYGTMFSDFLLSLSYQYHQLKKTIKDSPEVVGYVVLLAIEGHKEIFSALGHPDAIETRN